MGSRGVLLIASYQRSYGTIKGLRIRSQTSGPGQHFRLEPTTSRGSQGPFVLVVEIKVQTHPFRKITRFDEIVTRSPAMSDGTVFVASNLMTRHIIIAAH